MYVMRSSRLFFRCKIGVTKHLKFRISDVDVTTKGKVSYVVYYRFWFPYLVEGMLHGFFSSLRSKKMKGASGGTEWFWVPPLVGGVILSIVWCVGIILNIVFCIFVLFLILYTSNNGNIEGVFKVLERIFM